jgi:hypothetical protein
MKNIRGVIIFFLLKFYLQKMNIFNLPQTEEDAIHFLQSKNNWPPK